MYVIEGMQMPVGDFYFFTIDFAAFGVVYSVPFQSSADTG